MKSKFKKTIILLATVIFANIAMAQQMITGTVLDEMGEPAIGANVMSTIANKKQSTATDINGVFRINVPLNSELTISYIGYEKCFVKATDKMVVRLKENNAKLNEVVVLGYGSLKQRNVTGAVEVIQMEELKDLNVSSLSEALIGLSPSIHVELPGTGRPGETSTITIRQARDAVSMVPTGTDQGGKPIGGDRNPRPLYVIDEFITSEEAFNDLDIDEVESISVLKDAEAAIYGAYGAYGVILVKTKRGKAGKPQISYQFQLGVTDAIKHADMLSGYDYARIYNAAQYSKTGKNESIDPIRGYFQADELESLRNTNYDLLNKYWKPASTQRHSININGGNEKSTFFTGISYQKQDGNIGKLDYESWNYRAGINANISDYFKATLSLSGSSSSKNQHLAASNSEEDYIYMLMNPSYVPDEINGYSVYNSGMENDPSFNNYYNYSSMLKTKNNRETLGNSMSIQGALTHDFSWWKPLKGLTAKLTYSRGESNDKENFLKMENTVYRVKNRGGSGGHLYVVDPEAIINTGTELDGFRFVDFENLEARILNSGQSSYLRRTMTASNSYQLNFLMNYSRKFGEHDVSGSFGIERGESWGEDLTSTGTHPLAFTDGSSNSLSNDAVITSEWGRSEGGSLAYILRANYTYKDRYMLQFLMRSQASTKFSPENYWGSFPGISAGWIMSDEPWFKTNQFVNHLKLRASFGVMGRDNVTAWRWLQLYTYGQNRSAIFGTNVQQESGRHFALPEKSGTNPDIHWDTNYKTNFGVEAQGFNGRLSMDFDAYYDMGREMFDFPSSATLPGTVGIYPAPENYAELDMWGLESVVGWRQRFNKDMYLSARVGLSYSDNKVLKFFEPKQTRFQDRVVGERTDRGTWGLSSIGMFKSYQEIEEYFAHYNITNYLGLTKQQVQPGMLIYEDVRGAKDAEGNFTAPDGIINTEDDIVKISNRSSNPYSANANLNFVWKEFSINATFQASWGSYTLMPSSLRGESFGDLQTTNINGMWSDMFVYDDYFDADGNQLVWSNRGGSLPNIRYSSINSQSSTYWRISGTEILLRNITLAWTFPKDFVKRLGMSNIRLNCTVQNAFSFFNPIPNNAWNDFAGSYGKYPACRKYNLGLNVTF